MSGAMIRTDWTRGEIGALFELPFNDLLFQAQGVHRAWHDPNAVQLSTLLSIKTGGCAENCGYCSQAAGNETDLK
ncbi:biotin synthase, partial [Sphingomonas sp. SRS2]